ncbi:hypothetical protein [Butyricicoccus porcorum]|uniref:hypothetical protein n=1 Tax=Butyricicoccus porcorum TaxID=1945634 RepID=UPI001054DA01|nr:hypothetical protein [Butyricicoccus porcorum]
MRQFRASGDRVGGVQAERKDSFKDMLQPEIPCAGDCIKGELEDGSQLVLQSLKMRLCCLHALVIGVVRVCLWIGTERNDSGILEKIV